MSEAVLEQRLESVDLVIAMLELLAGASGPMTLGEVARGLDISKPRTHRHLRALCANRYVYQGRDDRYAVGPGLIALADAARSQLSLAEIARPFMADLRDATGQSVTVSSVIGRDVTIVELLRGRGPVQFEVRPGTVLGATTSAHGLVALAAGMLPPEPGVAAATLAAIRAQGWADAPGLTVSGVNALAAPIRGRGGVFQGAVALVGSVDHIAADGDPAMLDALLAAARAISERLGWEFDT